MDKVSVYDGKARFSELVERAESSRSRLLPVVQRTTKS